MEAAGLIAFFSVLLWVLILAAIAVRVAIIVWCYKVGKSKGQEVVSLILGIFLGWIGLVICYVLPEEKRPDYPQPPTVPPPPPTAGQDTGAGKMMTCRNCARSIPATSRFCPHCGKET